jgi:serine/threonine protein phosphatase PrpC
MSRGSPVLGRPSPAAAGAAALRPDGSAAEAAYRADGGDCEWCALRAASVAGVRHRLAGEPAQDTFSWARRGDALAVAVADGVGSMPGSGATASRSAVAATRAALAGGGTTEAQVRAAVTAANDAAAGGEGASTLVVAVVGASGQAGLARVGDSTAFVVSDHGMVWREVFATVAGDDELVATVTAALPAGEVAPELVAVTLAPGDVLVLATDGIADPWRDGPATVAPTLSEAIAGRPDPLELAELADFSRQGCHDARPVSSARFARPRL